MTLMPVWPAGFLPTPDITGWDGMPFDSRAAFNPETGPPMFRRRVTAETWEFAGRFPAADQAEQAAFWEFWAEIEQGAKPFLWRDPQDDQPRKWVFAAEEPVRTSGVSDTHRDFQMRLIRLPSTPWWAWMIPADRTVAPLAAYDFRRGLYHNGAGQIGRASAFGFTRAGAARFFDTSGVMQVAANDVPRFDHWPATGARRGLMVEPARVNYATQSQSFGGANWTATGVSVNATHAAAPDGSMTAALVANTGGVTALISRVMTVPAHSVGQQYFASLYVRPVAPNTKCTLNCYWTGQPEDNVTIDTATGAVTGAPVPADVLFEPAGGGWWRIGYRMTGDASGASPSIGFRLWPSGRNVTSGDCHIWGAQLEPWQGFVPSSYVPTTTAAVARGAEAAGLVAAHGACDARVIYDDGSAQTLLAQVLAAGWWPTQQRPHIAGIAIFAAGALA